MWLFESSLVHLYMIPWNICIGDFPKKKFPPPKQKHLVGGRGVFFNQGKGILPNRLGIMGGYDV